jgi:hypothetical protein
VNLLKKANRQRAKEEGKLDLVLKHYGMTEEDLYPWKKKYRKLQNSKGQQKKPTPKRPVTEEEGNKRKQRPKSDSSSDEMMGGNPKNFDYYFGGKKKEEGKMDSKEERQRQTDHDNNPNSKGKDKQNTDTTHAQVVRVENIAPILQPFIPSQQETVQVPEQPEYVPLPNSAKILASEAKVRDWLKSSTPPVSVISNDVPRLNEPPNKGEPLFGYNFGYYVTAAAAAGLAALIGAGVYAWQGRKRSSKDDKDEEAKVGTKGSRRLHARDWRLVGDD